MQTDIAVRATMHVLHDDRLYLSDGGRCICGFCAEPSVRYSGKDEYGGLKELTLNDAVLYYDGTRGDVLRCEKCGRGVARET
jgi:hypothetical protein